MTQAPPKTIPHSVLVSIRRHRVVKGTLGAEVVMVMVIVMMVVRMMVVVVIRVGEKAVQVGAVGLKGAERIREEGVTEVEMKVAPVALVEIVEIVEIAVAVEVEVEVEESPLHPLM